MSTFEDPVTAVARLGFTERQVRFLVHVMRFGGLCVPRQYARFAGTAYGHGVTRFFAKLVARGHVTPCRCLHHRGRLYHVRGRQLYEAIGEPRHPHRKPVPSRQVIDRLMVLDAVIGHPKLRWLITEPEKLAFVRRIAPSLPPDRLPHVASGAARRRVRLFPDRVLLGVNESDEPTFVYVVTSPAEDDWRRVIARHGDLLAALPRWTFRACVPPELEPRMARLHIVFREELAEPLSPSTVRDLKWHFEQLRGPTGRRAIREEERFQRGQFQLMMTPRFQVLHERWLTDGDAAFELASSREIVDRLASAAGRVTCVRLPVSYQHLVPVLYRDRSTREGVEQGVGQGAQEGDDASARPQPPLDEYEPADPACVARDGQRLVDGDKALRVQ